MNFARLAQRRRWERSAIHRAPRNTARVSAPSRKHLERERDAEICAIGRCPARRLRRIDDRLAPSWGL